VRINRLPSIIFDISYDAFERNSFFCLPIQTSENFSLLFLQIRNQVFIVIHRNNTPKNLNITEPINIALNYLDVDKYVDIVDVVPK